MSITIFFRDLNSPNNYQSIKSVYIPAGAFYWDAVMLLMVNVLSNYCSPLTGTWENSKSEIFIVLTSIENRKNLTK